ncbi:MAG TPA: Spy/CpxP family protein refolding chaperone [Bryobacteraceae bacterium]
MSIRYVAVCLCLTGLVFAQQQTQTQPAAPGTRGGRGGRGPGFGPGELRLEGRNVEQRLTKQLNLNATQQNTVHTVVEESKVILQGMDQKEAGLRTQLATAVRSGDASKIDSLTQELSTIHQQRSATEAKGLSKIYASLSSDQKAKVDPAVNRSLGVPGGRRGPRPAPNGNAPQTPTANQ